MPTEQKPKLYLVCPSEAEAGALETLPETEELIILSTEELESSNLRFSSEDKICITSEATLELVQSRIDDTAKKRAIGLLKDKYQFRNILKEIYPDYKFKTIEFEDIAQLSIKKKMVIKPLKGCFGTAVKIVDENSDLNKISEEIKQEINRNAAVLSENVLTKNEFVVEDYIDGEEYAIDMFYDESGKPHIVSTYHHPMPRDESYLHMIYYSSREVFEKLYDEAIKFYIALNKVLKLKNCVLHSEFRYNDKGLFPIEINSMRFGGMGLGNMVFPTMGINPYQCFINGSTPSLKNLWQRPEHANSNYTFFIAYNGKNVNPERQKPNISKIRSEFSEIILEKLFDYKSQLAFGIFCLKETPSNIEKLLEIDFDDFFEPN